MGGGFRRLRIVLPLILLVMILMRLVWMQLRSYPVFLEGRAVQALAYLQTAVDESCLYDPMPPHASTALGGDVAARAWLMSPGYAAFGYSGCLAGVTGERPIVRLNQWLLAATVLLCVMATRFLTSSWTVALIVGAMLMSRGRLLADIGQVSVDFPAMLAVTAWLMAQTHYLRTGSLVSLACAVAAAVIGALVDRSMAALALAMPIMLGVGFLYRRRLAKPVLERLRGARRRSDELAMVARPFRENEVTSAFGRFVTSARWLLGMEFPADEADAPLAKPAEAKRGGLFRPLSTPFLLWVYAQGRWLRLGGGWLFVFGFSVGLSLLFYRHLAGPTAWVDLVRAWPRAAAVLPELVDTWQDGLLSRFDLHLTVSLFVLLYCAAQSPAAGLVSFLEASWLTLLSGVLVGLAAFALDGMDLTFARNLGEGFGPLLPRPVAQWFEPAVLALGTAGIYNLMKVLDTRVAKKP